MKNTTWHTADKIRELLEKACRVSAGTVSTIRWAASDLTVSISTPGSTNPRFKTYHDLAHQAVDEIKWRLPLAVKKVKHSKGAFEAESGEPVIVVEFGNAFVPGQDHVKGEFQNFVANVSSSLFDGGCIALDGNGGKRIKPPVFVHIGHEGRKLHDCKCTVTLETVLHEFGHALGLMEHFEGFENEGDAISRGLWDVLATLYTHPPGTAITSELVVCRARGYYRVTRKLTSVLEQLRRKWSGERIRTSGLYVPNNEDRIRDRSVASTDTEQRGQTFGNKKAKTIF